jgi:hypothetical protein
MGIEHELDCVVDKVLAEVIALLHRLGLGCSVIVLDQVGKPPVSFATQESVVALEPAAQQVREPKPIAGQRSRFGVSTKPPNADI